jgi:hypothetical protein
LKRRSAARTAGAWSSPGGSKAAALAAVDQTPARGGTALANVRHGELQCDLGEGLRGSDGTRIERKGEFTEGGTNGGTVVSVLAQERAGMALIAGREAVTVFPVRQGSIGENK